MTKAKSVPANLLDRAIAAVAPRWALHRLHARVALAYYEAARPNRQRSQRREDGSANTAVRAAGLSIRAQARHLDQNHDLSRGLLRTLVNNTIGAGGIGIEPQPMTRDGTKIHEGLAAQLQRRWERWCQRPETTRELDWAESQRLLARSAFRDGEALLRHIEGVGPQYQHSTQTPYSVQLLEADHLPLGYNTTAVTTGADGRRVESKIYDGIEVNPWGASRAYWLFDELPTEGLVLPSPKNLRRIPANQIAHLCRRDRLHQRRGMSEFASVLERLDDLRDYETSETVAAKVAASLSAAIIKGSPDLYAAAEVAPAINDADGSVPAREMKFRAGMVFDDLRPGESVEMIGSNGRPNAGMVDFRHALLRAIAAGPGVTFSSLAKYYGGNYSSQRQELVESWIDYAVLSAWFISVISRPVYERFVAAELSSGNLSIPADADANTVSAALYIPPSMPWIDPSKEATAWEKLEQAGHASGPEIIRRRGRNPRQVRDDEINWRKGWRDRGEQITADPASADITQVPGFAADRNPDEDADVNP